MTIIVGWIAFDNHSEKAPFSSAYIISDSRYTWGNSKKEFYDHGRKLFAFKNSPDLLAYCGDVIFPISTISQIVELADNGLLFAQGSNSYERNLRIYQQISNQFRYYPDKAFSNTKIYHISRDIDNTFKFYEMSYISNEKKWLNRSINIESQESHILFCAGSGKNDFYSIYAKYSSSKSLSARTSRSIFQCFLELLHQDLNSSYGGSPQLVGLYRSKGNGINFGIIQNKKRYYLGSPIQGLNDYRFIEWRNENFEICDGKTMRKKESAAHQPNTNFKR